jgi:hypothetical protein
LNSKARAARRVVDCIYLVQEHGLNTATLEHFPAVSVWSDFNHCHRQFGLFSPQNSVSVRLNMTQHENGQLPAARGSLRSKISSDVWEQVKTAYATGSIRLREIARNMGIPEGTVLARAKREGWAQEIQSAKALVKREDSTPTVRPVEAVAMSMQQRGERHVERMAV